MREVFVHCFMDGRDTPPESGVSLSSKSCNAKWRNSASAKSPRSSAATTRWIATSAGSASSGHSTPWSSATARRRPIRSRRCASRMSAASRTSSSSRSSIVDDRNEPVGLIRDDDVCINFNYRADRAREITMALTDKTLGAAFAIAGTEEPVLRDDDAVRQELRSAVRAAAGASEQHPCQCDGAGELKNLRVAETEKYAHVTYFFNGGDEKPFGGEEREMVPRRRSRPTI